MKQLLLILMLFVTTITIAQKENNIEETYISNIKAELNTQNISDFFIVKHITYGVAGIIHKNDTTACNSFGTYFTMYALWKKGKTSYIQKFDNCGKFNSLKLPNTKLIDYYRKNTEGLKLVVKPYQLTPDSITNGLVYKTISSMTHQPQRYFRFYTKSSEFKNHYDTYDTTTNKDKPNLNFEYNNSLPVVKLNALCEKTIDSLEEKKVFQRLQE